MNTKADKTEFLNILNNFDASNVNFNTQNGLTNVNFANKDFTISIVFEEETEVITTIESYNINDNDKGILFDSGDDNQFEEFVYKWFKNILDH